MISLKEVTPIILNKRECRTCHFKEISLRTGSTIESLGRRKTSIGYVRHLLWCWKKEDHVHKDSICKDYLKPTNSDPKRTAHRLR